MLVCFVYVSCVVEVFGEYDFNVILKFFCEYNQVEGIIGLLCYSEGVFIQLFEGGCNVVNVCYKQIIDDFCYKDVILLVYDEIIECQFVGWVMGQVQFFCVNWVMLLKYLEFVKFDFYVMSGKVLVSLFYELVSVGVIVCS